MMIRQTKILDTASAVIDAVGGTGAAARLARASIASVSNWRRRGYLAERTFLNFQQALAAIDATAPAALWRIDDPQKTNHPTGTL